MVQEDVRTGAARTEKDVMTRMSPKARFGALAAVAAVLAFCLTVMLAVAVQAAPRKAATPRGPAAGECQEMVQIYGPQRVIWGRFSGGKEDDFFDRGVTYHTEEMCFASAQQCERWLYNLKTEFNYMPRYNQCRPGYEPGAPVPRW